MSLRQDLADPARIPGDLLAALAELRSARRAALAEAGELVAERNALAAEARRGDARAGERVGELNRRGVALAVKIDQCDVNENALGERIAEVLELAQRATPGRPDGIAIARALEAQFVRADELMRDLATTFLAVSSLNRRLASTSKGSVRGLNSPGRRQAAAAHWGLDAFLAMQPIPQHLRAPLLETAAPLLQDRLHPRPRFAAPAAPVKTTEEIRA
jgi:hypothetical protein